MTQMSSPLNEAFVRSAIFAPSGDQSGVASVSETLSVTSTWAVPSAFIVQMSARPPPERVNVILLPSGDQDASPSKSGLVVSWTRPEPFAFITTIS